ncbi:unnamed protein product [Closterium sp. NIES-64]|nr:unnamed protein product [Closterium sp. NIES-64]
MAGLAEGLACDDDAGMSDSDDELEGLEEARTGLDLLLHSLGPGDLAHRPPTAKPAPVRRENRDHPPLPSSPDSIRSEPVAPAGVSDTVVVESPTTKSSAPRNFNLKQSTLSWAKPSSSTAVEQPVVNNTSSHPPLVIDISEAIDAIKRTTRHIESRYVDCGDDFGGGSSQWLTPFLERHGPGCSREVKVEGVDSDGRPSTITFNLHDEPVASYSGPEDHDGCIQLCTEFVERIVANLEERLGDLDSLSGVRLFTPDAWPLSKSERNARCQEWLHSLVTMFKAQEREEILPGDNKKGKHEERVDADDEEAMVGDAGGSSSDEDDEMSS